MGSMNDDGKTEDNIIDCYDYNDSDEETIGERLWGLTEMFPENVRNSTITFFCGTKSTMKYAYSFTRTTLWIIFSSSAILLAPVLFEIERAQIEDVQKSQQKEVLLGPNTATPGLCR